MRRIESYSISGPVGKLEALLEEPETPPSQAWLVCHPHPLGGGTMHNKVVYRIARALRRKGAVVLRFNFRGVGLSEGNYDNGRGELEDARAALHFLRARYPQLPYSLAGFSFGSRIALRLASAGQPGLGAPLRLLAVGLPREYHAEIAAILSNCLIEKGFVHSTLDQYASVEEMEEFYQALPPPKKLIWIEARDHFFEGALDRLEEAVSEIAED